MAHTYAGILGPIAFLTSVARGVVDGGSAESVLFIAWCSLLVFSVVGYVVGWIAERAVVESVRGRIEAEVAAEKAGEGSKPAVAGTVGV